ncbi:MAG: PEP-CTERM sorting domain-containing protein [Bryobacterales bacterium]|nr:PEP-CTERM sorting domain-containing protein [Bryobacterales bacterium]
MRRPANVLTLVFLSVFLSSPCFSGAIVPGFDSTADGRNDDGTYTTGGCNNDSDGGTCDGTPVSIGFPINFYGSLRDSLFINTNGNVTFDIPLATFTPFSLDDAFRQIIAPFFADIDTRNPASGVVSFGNGTFEGQNAFGVNWLDVGYFNSHADKTNSFQLLLVDRGSTGAGNFDIIFNFDRVQFEAGDASFGSGGLGCLAARVGFSNGTALPGESLELPGSGVGGTFIDDGTYALITHRLNSDVDGRYIFGFRDGVYTVVPEPSTYILMLAGCCLLLLRPYVIRSRD